MFGFFKSKQRKAAEGAEALIADCIVIPGLAIKLWKRCCYETGEWSFGGNIYTGGYRNVARWRHIMQMFHDEWILFCVKQGWPNETEGENALKKRCGMWLGFIENSVMPKIIAGKFNDSECDKIGEFIAFCVVRGLNEALLSDPERSALIIESIPPDWIQLAKFDRIIFDRWYEEQTGKKRIPRI